MLEIKLISHSEVIPRGCSARGVGGESSWFNFSSSFGQCGRLNTCDVTQRHFYVYVILIYGPVSVSVCSVEVLRVN